MEKLSRLHRLPTLFRKMLINLSNNIKKNYLSGLDPDLFILRFQLRSEPSKVNDVALRTNENIKTNKFQKFVFKETLTL
jgi:hypothetical protein